MTCLLIFCTISSHELAESFWSQVPPNSLQVSIFIGGLPYYLPRTLATELRRLNTADHVVFVRQTGLRDLILYWAGTWKARKRSRRPRTTSKLRYHSHLKGVELYSPTYREWRRSQPHGNRTFGSRCQPSKRRDPA